MKVEIGAYPDEGEQKIDVHIDKWDTWSMDYTLAHIVLPMLKQLKETKHGAPNVDVEDVPEELWPNCKEVLAYDKDGSTDDNFFKRWDYVMDEMIWSFQHKVDDDWVEATYPDFPDETAGYDVKELEWKGVGPCQLRLFPDEFGEMEDYELYELVRSDEPRHFDMDKYKKYQDRISNGFRLFGKYFESLWD